MTLLMKALTYSVGLPVLRDEMEAIWQEQQKHFHCIGDAPGGQLYPITGSLEKAGTKLPTYRCRRASTSLESFHLHLNTYANRLSMNTQQPSAIIVANQVSRYHFVG